MVHTRDLTVDGADKDADIIFSMDLMRQVSIPMLILPGNHDAATSRDRTSPSMPSGSPAGAALPATTAGWRMRPAGGSSG